MNKQPFRLGTGGDWGFRGGDRGLGTYTWRCSTMNKQPFGAQATRIRGHKRHRNPRFWVLSTARKVYMNNLISVILLDRFLHQVGLEYVKVLSFN